MGLAGTKRKQRLVGSATTRNASWLNDESLPGQRLMAQMGWSQGQGIGLSSASEARTENIKAMFKMDNKGIGAQRAEREARASGQAGIAGADKWIGGGGELGGLFERLNASAQATPTAELSEAEIESDTKPEKSDKKRKREGKEAKREEKRESKEKKHSRKDDGDDDKRRKSKSKSKSKDTKDDDEKSRKSNSKEERKQRKSKDSKSRPESSRSSSSEKEVEESTTAQALSADPSSSSSAAAAAVIRNASRAKYLRAKRQLYGDAASMNEILGIKSDSNGGTPDVAATDVESALASAVESQQQQVSSSNATTSIPLTAKQLKKLDKKKDKAEAKAEKKKEKKDKKKAAKEHEANERKRKATTTNEETPAAEEPQPVLNTVSPYSVHEYLSRRLMLKKAQVQKKSRADKDVWGRLCGGEVPRTATASTGTLVTP